MELDSAVFSEWISSSRFLFCAVVAVSAITLPLLGLSLHLLRVHKKSLYFVCLASITVANMVLLGTIGGSVLVDRFPTIGQYFHGSVMCKLRSFLVNVSSCFIHWTWVLMYSARCVVIFFPLQSRKQGRILQSRSAVLGVLIFSIATQLWTPVLMTELTVHSDGMVASFCDAGITDVHLVQWIAVIECILTFFVPFVLTVLTDVSVLVLQRPCQPALEIIPKEDIALVNNTISLKIVSKKNIQTWQHRRHLAIKRCLMLATLNLMLNLPNYSLQLLDQFLDLRSGGPNNVSLFLWADAIAYMLYLMQFPLVPLYLYFLRSDLKRGSSRIIAKKIEQSFKDQGSHALLNDS